MEEDNNKKKKHHNPSPAVVLSTGCSNFRSCVSLCRPFSQPPHASLPPASPAQGVPLQQQQQQQQQQPPAESTSTPLLPSFFGNGEAAAQAYWKRAKQLEQELRQLDKWLNAEKKLAECVKNPAKPTLAPEARDPELMRLADGSYLHEVKKVGRPWGRLAMHLSAPTLEENASSAMEVLRQMASMKPGDLCSSLHLSMPMADISGYRSSELKGKLVLPGSETGGYLENILLGAVEKMEGLVLEGLRIQMGTGGRAAEVPEKKVEEKTKGCVLLVIMIQIRDPKENYEAVGEPMIGFVEAATAAEVPGRRFDVRAVHVAGMKCTTKLSDGRDFMWSASLKGCKGSCCWHYVRNPDRVFCMSN